MKSKTLLTVLSVFVALTLLAGTCSAGFAVGRLTAPARPQTVYLPSSEKSQPTEVEKLFAPFWEAWGLVHEQYIEQPVDDEQLMRGAIKGMMEALGDEHSSYIEPKDYESFTILQSGEYQGIGAWVNTDAEYLTISEPMPGSPAEKAGLKPGDQIIAIDGVDMTGVDPEIARQHVLGPKGTVVRLTIRREGVEPFDVEITRASITVPSVNGKMLDSGVAYVRIFNFGAKTTQELKDTLTQLMAEKPLGLVLDLRNNGGGYRDTAIEVASQFIAEGVIMYEEYGNGQRDTMKAKEGGLATDIPMVVLVNELTASASEIVAGALQDYGRAPLVGVTTFGKGSVQIWTPLSNDEGAVRITVARWLTPNGRQIHKVGLTPDVVVDLTQEDFDAGRDPQLDKAVELLTAK